MACSTAVLRGAHDKHTRAALRLHTGLKLTCSAASHTHSSHHPFTVCAAHASACSCSVGVPARVLSLRKLPQLAVRTTPCHIPPSTCPYVGRFMCDSHSSFLNGQSGDIILRCLEHVYTSPFQPDTAIPRKRSTDEICGSLMVALNSFCTQAFF